MGQITMCRSEELIGEEATEISTVCLSSMMFF